MSKQHISPSIRKEMDTFIRENINAPHYCDFQDVDTLKQYSEEELKPIFGSTNVHYRWVQYSGGIELMSFNPNECVYNFGSIDPSKPVSDILVLEGVEPDNPKTYNETFIISPENNTFKDQFLIDDAIRRLRAAADNLPISSAQEVEEPAPLTVHAEPSHHLLAPAAAEQGDYDDIALDEKMHSSPIQSAPKTMNSVSSAPLPARSKPAVQPSVKHTVTSAVPVRSRYMDAVTSSTPIRKPAAPLTKGTILSSRTAEKKVLTAGISTQSVSSDRKLVRPIASVPLPTKTAYAPPAPPAPQAMHTLHGSQTSQASQSSQTSQTVRAVQTTQAHSTASKPASSTIPSYMRETKASAIRASLVKPVTRTNTTTSSYPRRPVMGTIVNRDLYSSVNRRATAAGVGEKPPLRNGVQTAKSVCPLNGTRSYRM